MALLPGCWATLVSNTSVPSDLSAPNTSSPMPSSSSARPWHRPSLGVGSGSRPLGLAGIGAAPTALARGARTASGSLVGSLPGVALGAGLLGLRLGHALLVGAGLHLDRVAVAEPLELQAAAAVLWSSGLCVGPAPLASPAPLGAPAAAAAAAVA